MEEIRAEVTALRAEVAQLRDEAADTRALAAMADRDAASVRTAINGVARTQSALRETQVEQGNTLRRIADAVAVLVTGQAALTETASRHEGMLTGLTETASRHEGMLTGLTETASRHEGMLTSLVAGQDALQGGQAEILRRLSSKD
jgi:hypothetical protein